MHKGLEQKNNFLRGGLDLDSIIYGDWYLLMVKPSISNVLESYRGSIGRGR